MARKPRKGEMVIYYEGDHEAGPSGRGTNGQREHPAIVTQIWSDTCVNLTVFFDAHPPATRTSSGHLPDEVFAEDVHCTNSGWRFQPD